MGLAPLPPDRANTAPSPPQRWGWHCPPRGWEGRELGMPRLGRGRVRMDASLPSSWGQGLLALLCRLPPSGYGSGDGQERGCDVSAPLLPLPPSSYHGPDSPSPARALTLAGPERLVREGAGGTPKIPGSPPPHPPRRPLAATASQKSGVGGQGSLGAVSPASLHPGSLIPHPLGWAPCPSPCPVTQRPPAALALFFLASSCPAGLVHPLQC